MNRNLTPIVAVGALLAAAVSGTGPVAATERPAAAVDTTPFLEHVPGAFGAEPPTPAEACVRTLWADEEKTRETAAWQGAAGRESATTLAALMRDTSRAAPLFAAEQMICSSQPRPLAITDLDHDGDLDVVSATTTSDNWYYLNDGTGTFERSQYDPLGLGRTPDLPEAIRDGRTDFTESDSYLCDVDGDGSEEVITIHSTGGRHLPISVQRTGESWPDTPVRTVESSVNVGQVGGFTCGDINGDGNLDVIYTMRSTPLAHETLPPPIRLLLGSEEGDLQEATNTWIPDQQRRSRSRAEVGGSELWGLLPLEPRLADLDGDGDLDLLVTADFGAALLYENLGDRYERHPAPLRSHYNTMGITALDVNGDELLDLMITDIDLRNVSTCPWSITCPEEHQSPSGHAILLQQAEGDLLLTVDESSRIAADFRWNGWGWGFTTADLNGDGYWDIIQAGGELGPASENTVAWAYRAQPPTVLLGSPQGFQNATREWAEIWNLPNGSLTVSAADMTGDGAPDIIIYGEAVGRPQLYRNLTSPEPYATLRLESPGTVTARWEDGRSETFRLPDRHGSFSVTSSSPWHISAGDGEISLQVNLDSGRSEQFALRAGQHRKVGP